MDQLPGTETNPNQRPLWFYFVLPIYVIITLLSPVLFIGIEFFVIASTFGTNPPDGLENSLWYTFYSLLFADVILIASAISYSKNNKWVLIPSVLAPIGFGLYFLSILFMA